MHRQFQTPHRRSRTPIDSPDRPSHSCALHCSIHFFPFCAATHSSQSNVFAWNPAPEVIDHHCGKLAGHSSSTSEKATRRHHRLPSLFSRISRTKIAHFPRSPILSRASLVLRAIRQAGEYSSASTFATTCVNRVHCESFKDPFKPEEFSEI